MSQYEKRRGVRPSRGVHPIGGPQIRGPKGSPAKRLPLGEDEQRKERALPTGQGERSGAFEDEIGRFKGMGYLGEGGRLPLSGGDVERSETKGVGTIEIPLPLGDLLVPFDP